MAVTVTIAGVNRTADILRDDFQIIQELTWREDTCEFTVKSGPRPSEGDEVIVTLDGTKIFAGIIDSVSAEYPAPGLVWYKCSARDYTYKLDAKLVVETYENLSADAIFVDIVAKYCSGFSTAGVQVGAPVVEYIVFDYRRPSECFKELCEYVGWGWYCDYDKVLHFFSPQDRAEPAPVEITAANCRNFVRDIDIEGLRNRVYVRGGTMLSDPWTYEVKADGVARAWVLPHKPHDLTVKVSGVTKTVGIEYVDDEATKDFLMNYQEKYVRCSAQTPTPAAGVTLSFTYRYDIDVITMVEDIASQQAVAAVQGGDGIYEHVIVDDSLTTIDAAEAAGLADLREHANPKVKGSFETEVPGWAPGQLVTIDLPDRGIQGTFLVQKVAITPATHTLWTYKVEYGGRLLGIADWLQALWKAQQKKKLNETALLHKFNYGAETAKVTDELGPTIVHCLPPLVLPAPVFSRSSVAYKSDGTRVAVNAPRFEPGRFGQAVMVEEGTTNYIPDSDGDGNPDNWYCTWNRRNVAPAVKEFITVAGIPGKVLHIQDTSAGTQTAGCQCWEGFTSLNRDISGKSFTLSFWVKGTYTGCGRGSLVVNWYNSQGSYMSSSYIPWSVTPDWNRVIGTVTAPGGAYSAHIAIYLVEDLDTGNSYDVYCGGLQFEEKTYATSWAGMGATRSPELLTIPTAGILNPQEGTVEFWARLPEGPQSYLFGVVGNPDGSNNRLLVYGYLLGSGNQSMQALIGTGSNYVVTPAISVTRKVWHYYACRWAATELKLTVDNITVSTSRSGVCTFGDTAYIGSSLGFAQSGAFIDDLRISGRARTDAEIAAAYQGGQPLPVDADTTYKLNFDSEIMDYVRTPLCGFVMCSA